MLLDLARLLLFPAVVIFAATIDVLTMRIPNWVSLILIAGFFVLALAGGMPPYDMLMHAAAGAAVLAAGILCFSMGWMGGGDAKVAGAVALWFGFSHIMEFLVFASFFGGVLTLLILQLRRWPLPYPLAGQAWLVRLQTARGAPYGVALMIGALLVYPDTEWMKAIDLAHLVIR